MPISLTCESKEKLSHTVLKFSGGEIQVRLNTLLIPPSPITIFAHLTNADEIMELVLLVDAIRRAGNNTSIHLICPYLPYARQDRVCASGESLALKVMCDLINGLNFESVTVWDVHSDVALALLDRVQNIPQKNFVSRIQWHNTVLVAPDAGAIKKTLETAKATGLPMIRADKVRSVETGEITGTVVYTEFVGDKDFLIVDDICDGGRTFVELAKVLRPYTNGKVYLYVTHGIFSKGLLPFDGLIDHIYTALPFPGTDYNPKYLTILTPKKEGTR